MIIKTYFKRCIDQFSYGILLLCLALYSPNHYAQEELAGRVVAVNGSVTAIDPSGTSRALRRRSEIYVGDTVVTQASSFAQIRMQDQAIIALKESTQFEILAYAYTQDVETDESTMRLIEGGFRTITGNIGRANRDAYKVETDFATIGIRGTDHEGVITPEGLYTGVYDGGTQVSNAGGSIQLGVGVNFDFGLASDQNSPPIGLVIQPLVLGAIPVVNTGGDEQNEENDGGDGNDSGDGGDADTGNGDGNGNTDGGSTSGGSNSGGSGNLAPPSPSLAGNQLGGNLGGGANGGQAQEVTEIQVNPNEINGDGTLSCTLNSTNIACRPQQDPAPPEPAPPEPAPPEPAPPEPAPPEPAPPEPAPPEPAPPEPAPPEPAPPEPAPPEPAPPEPAPPEPAPPEPAPPEPAPPEPAPAPETFYGFTEAELTNLKNGVLGLAAIGDGRVIGGVSNGAGSSNPLLLTTQDKAAPYIVVNTLSADLLRFNGLSRTFFESIDGFALSWGLWETGSPQATLLSYDNSSDTSIDVENLDQSIVLTTVDPLQLTEIADRMVKKQFVASDYLITARGFGSDQVESVTGGFYVDLNIGAIFDLYANLCIGTTSCSDLSDFGTSNWPLFGFGTSNTGGLRLTNFNNTVFDLVNPSSYFLYSDVGKTIRTKEATGVFLGENDATGFVLTFETEGWSFGGAGEPATFSDAIALDPTKTVGGSILFTANSTPVQFAIADSERASISNLGLVAGTGTGFIFFGGASSLDPLEVADPIFTSTVTTANTSNPGLSVFNYDVIREAGATLVPGPTLPSDLPVVWGTWDSLSIDSIEYYNNAYDITAVPAQAREGFFTAASFEPTTYSQIQANASRRFTGYSALGDSTLFIDGAFEIVLTDNGLQLDSLQFDLCAHESCNPMNGLVWSSDTFNDISLSSNRVSISKTGINDRFGVLSKDNAGTTETYDFKGSLTGGFTGDNGQGFVAGFSFADNIINPDYEVDGAAVFIRTPELSQTESASLNKVGFASFTDVPLLQPNSYAQRGLIGPATDGSSGSPVIIEQRSGLTPGTDLGADPLILNSTDAIYNLVRSDIVDVEAEQTVGGINGLTWGTWQSFGSSSDLTSFLEGANKDYSSAGDLTTTTNEVLYVTGNLISDILNQPFTYLTATSAQKRWSFSGANGLNSDSSSQPMRIVSGNNDLYSFFIDSILEFDLINGNIEGFFDVYGCSDPYECDNNAFKEAWTASFIKSGADFAALSDNEFNENGGFRFPVTGALKIDTNDDGDVSDIEDYSDSFEGEIYGFFTDDADSDVAISTGFSFGGSEPDGFAEPDNGSFIAGLAFFEATDLITQEQIQEVSDGPNFGFMLTGGGISGAGEKGFFGPMWGWTDSNEGTPLLLQDADNFNGLDHIADLPDYFQVLEETSPSVFTEVVSPNKFTWGFSPDFNAVGGLLVGGDESTILNDYGMFWGTLDTTADNALSIYDSIGRVNELDSYDTNVLALFVSAPPAYNDGTPLTGIYKFGKVAEFIGLNDANQTIQEVRGTMTLDLNTGNFNNGALQVCFLGACDESGSEIWSVGNISLSTAGEGGYGTVEQDGLTGSITVDGSDTDFPNFGAQISGFVIDSGTNQQGFVLGFEFGNSTASSAVDGQKTAIGAALFQGDSYPTFDQAFRDKNTGFGFAISRGITPSYILGNASHGDTNEPSVVSFTGTSPTPSGNTYEFFNDDPDLIVLGDTFSRKDLEQQYGTRWSTWDSSGLSTFIDDTPSIFDDIDQDLIIVSTDAPLAKTTGIYTFASTTTVSDFTGFATSRALTNLRGSFGLDFDDGTVNNGYLEFDVVDDGLDETWQVEFVGVLKLLEDAASNDVLSYFETTVNSSSRIYDNLTSAFGNFIEGDIFGLLADAGEGTPVFNGGFSLAEVGDADNNVIGTFLWGSDDFLSAKERFRMEETRGIFVTGSAQTFINGSTEIETTNGIFGGPVFDGDGEVNGDEVFINRALDFETIEGILTFDLASFDSNIDLVDDENGLESIFRNSDSSLASRDTSSAVTSVGVAVWGSWNGATGGTIGVSSYDEESHSDFGGVDASTAGNPNAYWFVADPLDISYIPTTGTFSYGGTGNTADIRALQGTYSSAGNNGLNAATYASIDYDTNTVFQFDIDFGTAELSNGSLTFTAGTGVDASEWNAGFSGFIDKGFVSATIADDENNLLSINGSGIGGLITGSIKGYLVGDTSVEGVALGFNLSNTTATTGNSHHRLFGTVLVPEEVVGGGALELPAPTTDSYDIAWGKWDNPIDQNWVVVTPETNGQVEIQTGEYLASVTPTPIANLTGTGNYESTIASSFIGSGSAGDVTQVVAGMAVDFNTGSIANGLLQVEVANSQAWQIDFSGTVNAGLVELNSTSGLLMDPGGIISNSIDANLGGVFTGNAGEAFVGGFELVDQINSLNHVEGIYTIER